MQIETEQRPLSILQLNQQIKQLIESGIGTVWIQAEISNFKPHSSGHFYLSLKDETSQIKAVMFRGYNSRLKFRPKDGQLVLARGQVSVYAPRGEYQIYIEHMEPLGEGALQKAFENLKNKLKLEGLFDSTKKRSLPLMPKGIAVVTSPTGAAIQDILNILKRRAPNIPVTIIPSNVQGASAAPQLIEALQMAYRLTQVDVIILGRGGGSIEDMWCFNDEALARCVAQSPIPIISAVGHEIDFTICDFVADLRAPTPSAAAELVSKNQIEVLHHLTNLQRQLETNFTKNFKFLKQKVLFISKQLVDPQKNLRDLLMRQSELHIRLQQSTQQLLKSHSQKLLQFELRLEAQADFFKAHFKKLEQIIARIKPAFLNVFTVFQNRLIHNVSLLDSLSPLQVLSRGFSITKKLNGEIILSPNQIKVGEDILTQFNKHSIVSTVTHINLPRE
jgi:exodeoxyribonuclease VII large subunit